MVQFSQPGNRIKQFWYCWLVFAMTGISFGQKSDTSLYTIALLQLAKEWSLHKYFDSRVFSESIDMDDLLLYRIRQLKDEGESNWKHGWVCDTIGKLNPGYSDTPTYRRNCFEGTLCFAGESDTSRYQSIRDGFSANLATDGKFREVQNPDNDLRLLAFCRLYGAIYCFSPFKDAGIKPLDTLFVDHVMPVSNASDQTQYNLELMRFMSALKDGHAIPFSSERETFFGRYYLPFTCELINGTAIVTETTNRRKCRRYKIRRGDTVITINNDPVHKRISRFAPYISVTNEKFRSDLCLNKGFDNNRCDLTFIGAGSSRQIVVKLDRAIYRMLLKRRIQKRKHNVQLFQDRIIYVNLVDMEKKDFAFLARELSDPAAGLIVDIRGYPGTGNLERLLDLISNENTIISLVSSPSRTSYGCYEERADTTGSHAANPLFSGKLVVLVNETTLSQGEYACMVLQSLGERTEVVGSKTAGCDGDVCMIGLPGRVSAMFTGMEIKYPDRTPTQNRGVKIDFEVRRKINDIIENRDPESELSIEILRSQKR